MTIIDLGEVGGDVTPDPPARRPRPAGRPYRSVLVLVVVLLTLAGAAPRSERVAVTLPGGPAAAAFVAGDRVYVVQPPDPQRGVAGQFIAYRVDAAGRAGVRWRTPLPVDGVTRAVWERGGVVLLVRTANDSGWETVALDAGTGRIGWRQSGLAVPVGDGVLFPATGEIGAAPTRGVDPATGRTRWTVPGSPRLLELSFGTDRLVRASASGMVEVYDAVSGVRLVARPLRPGVRPAGPRTMAVAGGLLLVSHDAGDTVTGYDLDTLDPRWTASVPLGYAERCGRLLCVLRQGGGMAVLDPITGATRWTDDRWAGAPAAADGRLLVAAEAVDGTRLAVVEEATGRLVGDFGNWALVPRVEGDGPVLGVRPGAGGRLLLAELDLAAARAVVRGALPGATGECRASTALLVCRRLAGFVLWRFG